MKMVQLNLFTFAQDVCVPIKLHVQFNATKKEKPRFARGFSS